MDSGLPLLRHHFVSLPLCGLLLGGIALLSLRYGVFGIDMATVWGCHLQFVINSLRMPRIVVAVLAGMSLATSGALFQALINNPLVSPDIIGIDTGATACAIAILAMGLDIRLLPLMAFAGALATAAMIFLLAWRRGFSGGRLVLVGIGVNALLSAVITYLLVRYPIERVSAAARWQAGTLASSWSDARMLAVGLVILLPVALLLTRRLQVMQLGDGSAMSLGVGLEKSRLAVIATGCGLSATVVCRGWPSRFCCTVGSSCGPFFGRCSHAGASDAHRPAGSGHAAVRRSGGPTPVRPDRAARRGGNRSDGWSLPAIRFEEVQPCRMIDHPVPNLWVEHLSTGYGGPKVLENLTTAIPPGEITAIVGANASGKSTFLRTLARLLRPSEGVVLLDGDDVCRQPTRSVATRLGLLPQSPREPEGVVVEDLVRLGRYPHQRLFSQWSKSDEQAVNRALELAGLVEIAQTSGRRTVGRPTPAGVDCHGPGSGCATDAAG